MDSFYVSSLIFSVAKYVRETLKWSTDSRQTSNWAYSKYFNILYLSTLGSYRPACQSTELGIPQTTNLNLHDQLSNETEGSIFT